MLPIADLLHRGVVLTCVGLCGWGIYLGASVHQQTLDRGKEILARRKELAAIDREHELREKALAEAAQEKFRKL